MSLEAWGDTDEDGLIDAMEHPVAAALAEVRDEIEDRVKGLRLQYNAVDASSIYATQRMGVLSACFDELTTLRRSVEEKIEADMGPRQ